MSKLDEQIEICRSILVEQINALKYSEIALKIDDSILSDHNELVRQKQKQEEELNILLKQRENLDSLKEIRLEKRYKKIFS